MVSEWMENGNIVEFIEKDPNANRIEFVCVHFSSAGLWLTWSVGGCCKWFGVYAQP